MHYLLFIFSICISFSSLAIDLPITSLKERVIEVAETSLEFSARYPTIQRGRILELSLRDAKKNLVSKDIGGIALDFPSEKLYFDLSNRIVHKVEHSHKFTIKVSVNNPPSKLYIYLRTEEPPRQRTKIFTLDFTRHENYSGAASSEAMRTNLVSCESPAYVIQPTVLMNASNNQEIAETHADIFVEFFSKPQRTAEWVLDRQKWVPGGDNKIGKGRKIEITTNSHNPITIELHKSHSTTDQQHALQLALSERTEGKTTLILEPGQTTFFIKKNNIPFIRGEQYNLRITMGSTTLSYMISLQNHHFESKH